MRVVSMHARNRAARSVREAGGSIADCRRGIARGLFVLLGVVAAASFAAAQVNVTTHHYDNARSGANTNETVLTPQNVTVSSFGKLFSQTVNGYVYAQPLYLANVSIPGKGTHNVVFVATEGDSVYAFDADNNTGANASPLWQASLIDTAHGAAAGATTVSSSSDIGCSDLVPQVGITSTPVIDPATGTMYVEANSKEGGVFIHRLHALDVTTGAEKSPGPVVITATIPGTGDGSVGGQIAFDALRQLNRPALLLVNGAIFLGYASHCDSWPYHGWVFAFDAATFTQKGVFNTAPNGGQGGIWMSGSGLAADASGNVYVATGNGTFDTVNVPATAVGDSLLKLGMSSGKLALLDYFTPYNQSSLNSGDVDLGSGGVLLLPDQPGSFPHLLVGAGKQGLIYLLNRDQMTKLNQHYCNGCSSDTQVVQESSLGQVGGLWSMPAYWNNTVYFWGSGDVLKSIPLVNGLLDYAHLTSSTISYNFPGATPTIAANGTSNGMLWSIDSSAYGAPAPGPAVLHAHDATNIARELWNSAQAANGRDQAGNAVKFATPVIVNGKVYVGTSTEVDVYGLFTSPPAITAQPTNQTVTAGQTATFTVAATGSPTPTVQWQVSTDSGATFSILSGAISTTLSFTTASSQNGNQYQAVFTNSAGTATTTAATLTVNPATPPTITTQPASQTVTAGQTATFSVVASGSAPLNYQWQKNTGTGFLNIPGAAAASYITPPTTTSDSGSTFQVVVSNAAGPVTSNAATLTVNPAPPPAVNFSGGFTTATGLQFNGKTSWNQSASRLRLTDGGAYEASSAFFTTLLNVQSFTNDFSFQLTSPNGDGFTFTIQNSGLTALGPSGGGLGYGPDQPGGTPGIGKSVAVKFDLYSNYGEGNDSTGMYTNGASPTFPAIDMTSSGVNLHSGDVMNVHMTYDGTTLAMTITDATVGKSFTTSWALNIPSVVGASSAYAGFTAGTGASTAIQEILTWTYASGPAQVMPPTITTQPANQTVTAGQTATFTAAATGSPTPTVQWQVSTDSGATFSILSGATSTTLSFTTASSQNGNQYHAVFTNSAGTATTTAATLVVNATADFSITASPSSQTVVQGSSTSYTATVTALNGFNGTVSLSASGLPSGATASFTPSAVTGSGTSTLSVGTSGTTPTGTYTVTITGTSGSLTHSTTVTLVVNATADFSITASPSSQTVVQGSSTSYTATVTALNGFNGTVNFSLTGLPRFSSANFNPTSVTSSGSSVLTVKTNKNVQPGTFTLTITGTSGSLVHSAKVGLTVP